MGGLLIRGVTVLSPIEELNDAYVAVRDGRIAMVGRGTPPADLVPVLGVDPLVYEASGLILCPGFIDLHVHGGGGSDTMDADVSSLLNLARTHAAGGTTRLLATTVSAPLSAIAAALEAVAEARALSEAGAWRAAHILGAHMEGPFLTQGYRGAHPAESVLPMDLDALAQCVRASHGAMKMVTFAPELPGALEASRRLRMAGIVPVMGHSGASYGEALCAIDAGMTHVTHVMNGMRGFHHREPGLLGAILSSPSVTVQLICDGIHVHPAIVRLLIACKGPARVALVTDGIEAVGLPDGEYGLASHTVTVKSGLCTLADGTIAGSTLTMAKAVQNVVDFGAVTRLEAVGMASLVPATILGLSHDTGSIQVGKLADIVLLDESLKVQATFVEGRLVYEAPSAQATGAF